MQIHSRSFQEAATAGDWYELESEDGRRLTLPCVRGLEAALYTARRWHRWPAGTRVRARRVLPGSRFGRLVTVDAGEHRVPVVQAVDGIEQSVRD